MFPPHWFLPYDAFFQLLTAFVALAVALYAMRGYRWVKEKILYNLFLAFLLLSVGLFINGVTLAYAYALSVPFTAPSGSLVFVDVGFWAYYFVSMLAYTLLIFAYINRLGEAAVTAAGGLVIGGWGAGGGNGGSSLLIAGPFMEFVLVILLIMVIVGQLAHLMVKRSRYSVMVTLSFLLLLGSHLLIMLSPLEDVMYVIGRVLELAGFVSIFGVLYGLRRGG
jgi:hypothetical protein